jgi:hypothetical protein
MTLPLITRGATSNITGLSSILTVTFLPAAMAVAGKAIAMVNNKTLYNQLRNIKSISFKF